MRHLHLLIILFALWLPVLAAQDLTRKEYYRTWTDQQGRQIEAAFKGLFDDEVNLLRKDGQRFTLPLGTLSAADASYARIISQGLSFDEAGYLKAARHGQEDILAYYHEAGIKPGQRILTVALIQACSNGDLEDGRLLLKLGANLNTPDAQGRLPLDVAVRSGRVTMVEMLLELGARIDLPGEGNRSLLTVAVQEGSLELVRLLLDHGALVERMPGARLGPVEWALTQPNRAVLEELLKQSPKLSPRVAWAVRAYQDGQVREIQPLYLLQIVHLDQQTPFDPENSVQTARMHMLLAGYDMSPKSFLGALAQNDMSRLELYIQAGAVEAWDFSAESPVWGSNWPVTRQEQRDRLFEAAGIGQEDRLLLQARCMDLSAIAHHANRLQAVESSKAATTVAAMNRDARALHELTLQEVAALPYYFRPYDPSTDWAGGTPAQRNAFDYMRAKYPELGKPDLTQSALIGPARESQVDSRSHWQQRDGSPQSQQGADQAPSINWNPEPLPGMPGSQCSSCRGDGVCFSCNGEGGRTMYGQSSPYGEFVRCSSCNGTGRCQWCRGTGKL